MRTTMKTSILCLAILLLSAAAARPHLRMKQPQTKTRSVDNVTAHRPPPSSPPMNQTTTPYTTTGNHTSSNATTTTNTTNVSSTLPTACQPVAYSCIESLRPIARLAHNSTAAVDEKDQKLEEFCATDCGKTYTDHITAVLQGACFHQIPPSTPDSHQNGSYVVVVDEIYSTYGGVNATSNATTTSSTGGGDDHNEEEEDDEQHDDQDENGMVPENAEANEAAGREAYDRFTKDRPGTALGCLQANDGQFCAAKQGCDFFNSCCYSSWLRIGAAAGYILSPDTLNGIEMLCPGSSRYLDVDGCA